jgi:phosphatidylglycerophosphatase A
MFRRPALPFFHPATLIATWFGSGLAGFAPGTWGSLAALPCAAGLVWLGGPWVLLAGACAVFFAGLWASARYAAADGRGDPGAIVVDEVAGQWLALFPVALDLRLYPVAFVAFRVFDIVKVWPANWMDRQLKGGLGIMADDLVAGGYAAAVAYAIALWTGQESFFSWTY